MWVSVNKRGKYSNVKPELIEHPHEWIGNHPQVLNSPISDDTLLVPDHKKPGKKFGVSKLLLQVSICEIHNDLIYESIIYLLKKAIDESSGKILVSDTALRSLMPNNARKMTDRYKQMCGFKICVIICSIQESLNNYPLKHLNLFREQVSYKGGRIALSGID